MNMRTNDEARVYLQTRLLVLSKVLFGSFTAWLGYIAVLYRVYPHVEPRHNGIIELIAFASTGMLALIWRLALARRALSIGQLRFIDAFYSIGTGTVFAGSALLAYDLRSSGYVCLVVACLIVLLRAVVVPSTGRRTVIIGIATCLPLTIATIVMPYLMPQDLPGPAYVSGGVVICSGAIALAAISSQISFGLRRKYAAAMQLGQYTLDGKIGEGGMGTVYRARHALLRRPTAIKLLQPSRVDAAALDRFEREVQHMSQLTHPNTVAIYDYGRNLDGVFYYAMEYLDGIDLERLVADHGAQPADRVVALLVQICGALHEAHGRGLIHRDVKPANIILCQRGDVGDVAKVVDFGLVYEIARRDAAGLVGTPAYLAPEAITDPERVGPAADLYAVGAVGYFLLTGRRVFDGKTPADVCVQQVTAQPVPPSQRGVAVAPALEAILLACLAKRPGDRPASAAALARQLRALAPAGDWDDDRASAWWDEFRRAPEATPSRPSLQTITIDVGSRVAQGEAGLRASGGSFGGREPCSVAPSTGV